MMAVNVDLSIDDLHINILAEYHVVEVFVSERTILQTSVKLLDVVDVTLCQMNRVTTGPKVHITVKNSHGNVTVHVSAQVSFVGEDVKQGS